MSESVSRTSLTAATRNFNMSVECATNNADKLTNGALTSLAQLTDRWQISMVVMVNVVLGVAAAAVLCPLLYLTQSSRLLYGVVWTMYSSLCFSMVFTYLEQSKILEGKNTAVRRPYVHPQERLPESLF